MHLHTCASPSGKPLHHAGMLCAMMATGIWLLVATFWELPVSTTHSIGALRYLLAVVPVHAVCMKQLNLRASTHGHLRTASILMHAPVSALAVGAIIGMTMVSAGPDAVIWSSSKDTFPYIGVSRRCYAAA